MKRRNYWIRALGPIAAAVFAAYGQALAGGLSFVEYQAATGPASPLRSVEEVAVSPDGANVYTAGGNSDMLGVYTRNPVTGSLTFLETEEDGVGGVDGLRNNLGVSVSPDGGCVYATGNQDDEVAVFSRNLVTGALTFVEVESVDRADAVVVSPDNRHVYVSGTTMPTSGVVHAFGRTPPACALTSIEVETGDGSGLGKGEGEAIAISPDGAHVYVGGTFFVSGASQAAVNVLSRNAGTGALTFVEREYNGANGVERMSRVFSLAISPDGNDLHVATRDDDTLVVFARNPGTGDLTFQELQHDGGAIDGLKGVVATVVDPNGAYVYTASLGDEAATVFRRDVGAGALRFLETQRDPLIDPPNLVLPSGNAIAVSPLGDSLYVGGKGLTVFAVDQCGNGNAGPDEQCDDGNVLGGDGCSPACRLELCGPAPSGGCRGTAPLASQLQIKNTSPDSKDQLQLKWNGGDATLLAEFGDPLTSASYLVCIYDGSANPQPLLAAAAPAGGGCKKGKPCWKAGATSYKYGDGLYTPDGLQILQLKEGLVNGKAKIQVKGRGLNLLPPALPLALPVTVQIKNTDTGVCWDAVFTTPSANQADKFKAKGD